MLAQEKQFDEILDYAMVRCELVRPPHYIVVMSTGSQALQGISLNLRPFVLFVTVVIFLRLPCSA